MQAATKIQAAWREYSAYKEYLAVIKECALCHFLDPYFDSDGWSATSNGSSVGSEAGEPLVLDDVSSALKFVETLPEGMRHKVEMVAANKGGGHLGRRSDVPPG